MSKITVVGLGPGPMAQLSLETYKLLTSGSPVYLRTGSHPCVSELELEGAVFETFDQEYKEYASFEQVYEAIVDRLITMAGQRDIVYAVPGHPRTAEKSVAMLLDRAKETEIQVEIKNAMSFLDSLFISLGIDPGEGVSIIGGQEKVPKPQFGHWVVIPQVYNRMVASEWKLDLMRFYPDEFEVYIVRGAGLTEEQQFRVPLYGIDREEYYDHLTCLAIPPLPRDKRPQDWDKLIQVMAQLRGPQGCPWDREQTHLTLRPYLVEESYEVLEALDQGDMHKLCEELGDLLLQIVFHAQLAEEAGDFTIEDVVAEIVEKLIRRHPHVFAGITVKGAEEVSQNWEEIKQKEKGAVSSIFDGLTRGLPALMYARKVQARAAKAGFDWPDEQGPVAKISEEMEELLSAQSEEEKFEELGDLLFAVVNLSRFYHLDPELALLQAVTKFMQRFRFIERECMHNNIKLEGMSLEELDEIWDLAKKTMKKVEKL